MKQSNHQLEIHLQYTGPDVEDGSMSLDDLVPVLQGFASAYGKVAGRRGIAGQHKLRLVAIRPGSADLILDVWEMVEKNAGQLQTVSALVMSAMAIVAVIIQIIGLKKHVKKQPYQSRAEGRTGEIVVVNSENVSLSASVEVFNMFREGELDNDLSKLTRPLESGRVDSGTIVVRDGEDEIRETIKADERQFFEVAEEAVTRTRETELTGQINTMTKSTNSGYVYLTDGTRVFFHLVSEHPENYYNLFSHNGLVRMRCVAHLDENLKPTQLDVFEMTPIQPELPFGDKLPHVIGDSCFHRHVGLDPGVTLGFSAFGLRKLVYPADRGSTQISDTTQTTIWELSCTNMIFSGGGGGRRKAQHPNV